MSNGENSNFPVLAVLPCPPQLPSSNGVIKMDPPEILKKEEKKTHLGVLPVLLFYITIVIINTFTVLSWDIEIMAHGV